MKKTFKFMVVAAVLVFAANSSLMAQFKFGVKASGNLSNIYMEDTTTTTMKPGFNIGVMGEYFLNDNMSVGAELLFSMQGAQEKHEGETLGVKWSTKNSITTNYINLPILVRYYFGALAVELGPQIGFCFGGNTKYKFESDGNTKEETQSFSDSEKDIQKLVSDYKLWNRLQVGGAIGVSYNMPMGLFFGARYTYDFTNLLNTINNEGKTESVKSNSGVISVSVGYKF
ncbi:MAG: PorT family protein [Bacteroidales bacterium]|nr:PorT family protein [Bacteroidales bacterium]